jgi:hypothetical protein
MLLYAAEATVALAVTLFNLHPAPAIPTVAAHRSRFGPAANHRIHWRLEAGCATKKRARLQRSPFWS